MKLKEYVNTLGGLVVVSLNIQIFFSAEIVWQLRGEAGKRQIEGAETGITYNFGGFGNSIISILAETI